jgi:hypothetical protein
MIFPIGQYLGAAADGAHEVQRGGATERLDGTSFAAWGLAHGPIDPVLAASTPWTREELVRYAGLAGLPEPADQVERRNHPDQPARFTIGFFDRALLQVDALQYEIWCWSSVYRTLWQVCETRAGDPASALSRFLAGVHSMVSTNSLYLDVAA